LGGGGGRHLFFAHPGRPVACRGGFLPGLDLKGDGRYVVAPPSLHASGKVYEWEVTHDPDNAPLAEMPAWLLNDTCLPTNRKEPPANAAAGVAEGQRNEAATHLAGQYFARGFDREEVLTQLRAWNERNAPPLVDSELRTVLTCPRLWCQSSS